MWIRSKPTRGFQRAVRVDRVSATRPNSQPRFLGRNPRTQLGRSVNKALFAGLQPPHGAARTTLRCESHLRSAVLAERMDRHREPMSCTATDKGSSAGRQPAKIGGMPLGRPTDGGKGGATRSDAAGPPRDWQSARTPREGSWGGGWCGRTRNTAIVMICGSESGEGPGDRLGGKFIHRGTCVWRDSRSNFLSKVMTSSILYFGPSGSASLFLVAPFGSLEE